MSARTPLLIIFVGIPGSGKTYFATRLSDELGAVRLNSDAMRLSIFGSLEEIDKTYHSPRRKTVNTYVFGAMDYVTKQVLLTGKDVVYEAIQSKKRDRTHMEYIAKEAGARLVLVSIEIDDKKAVDRVTAREHASDSRKFSATKAREVITHFRQTIEPFDDLDYVVHIDGSVNFEQQYSDFRQQVATLFVS